MSAVNDETVPQTEAVDDELIFIDEITPYDESHFRHYLRLLDADAAGADWREAVKIILARDADVDPEGARRCWEAHISRAKWMTEHGYKNLLKQTRQPRH